MINKKIKFKIITRYMLSEFIPTFAISFFFFFVMFIINHVLLYIKPLFERDVPLDLIFMLIITALPMYIIFCLPFGILLSTLMTMGRFSSDNEIVAFRALGFSMIQIFKPIIVCSLIITFIGFIFNDRILPFALHEQNIIKNKIIQIKPTLDFKSKTVKDFAGKIIITDIVRDTSIEGLIIIDEKDGQKQIISTKEAEITTQKERKNSIEISMSNAMIQFENRDRPEEFNYGYAKDISYYINFQEENDDKNRVSGNEKTTFQLLKDVIKYKKEFNTQINDKELKKNKLRENIKQLSLSSELYLNGSISNIEYINNLNQIDSDIEDLKKIEKEKTRNSNLTFNLIEFYRKFALPLACFIFAIFALPVGIYSRRAGYSIGFVVGLFVCALYWFSYYAGIFMGNKNIIFPFFATFLPDLIFLIIGIIFLIKRLKE